MIYLLLIVCFLFPICVLSNSINKLKHEIELLWNCIDNNRKRLTTLEEQSNVAYIELLSIIKELKQQT
jgi:hypothetical protein